MNQKIIKYQSDLIKKIGNEEFMFGGVQRWNDLSLFRNRLSRFVGGFNESYSAGSVLSLKPKTTILENGHVIDHHALGYFAPMEFKREGVGGRLLYPHEQLSMLSKQLEDNGVRLLYVPLPCKLAIYPELAIEDSIIPVDRNVIPQWRHYIRKCAMMGIEIVDCYEAFLNSDEMLFTKNHHISPNGAKLIGEIVAKYLVETVDRIERKSEFICKNEIIASTVMTNSGNDNSLEIGMEYFPSRRVLQIEKTVHPYTGYIDSEIGIIGDCNIQSYRGQGCDVTSNISYELKYPVKYIGRYLPFANKDTLDKIPDGSLAELKILLYIGFASASFVRAYDDSYAWCRNLIRKEAFGFGG